MNIIRTDFKLGRKTLFIWVLAVSVSFIMFAAFFSSFQDSMEAFRNILKAFPQSVLDSMGIDMELFSSFPAYLSYINNYIIIATCIYAMQQGLNITGREKTIGMSDFLMTKPHSRVKIIVSKYLAALILVMILTVILFIISILLNSFYGGKNVDSIIYMFIAMVFLECFFLGFGSLLGSIMRNNKNNIAISMATVFVLSFITMIDRVFDESILQYISPFSHLDISEIVMNRGFDGQLLPLNIFSTISFIVISMLVYRRQDFRK